MYRFILSGWFFRRSFTNLYPVGDWYTSLPLGKIVCVICMSNPVLLSVTFPLKDSNVWLLLLFENNLINLTWIHFYIWVTVMTLLFSEIYLLTVRRLFSLTICPTYQFLFLSNLQSEHNDCHAVKVEFKIIGKTGPAQ